MSASLDQLINNNALPATLLLYGPSSESLKASALKILPSSSLDFHLLAPESKNGLHTQASIEQLISETALPPFEAPFKLFVVEAAEKMLSSASNALLKILEEPPEDTYIALLSTDPSSLLSTIRSRCYAIEISAPQSSFSSDSFKQLLTLAQNRDYFHLMKALERELPQIQLEATFFAPQALSAERVYRLALDRGIKLRNALLHFVLSIS